MFKKVFFLRLAIQKWTDFLDTRYECFFLRFHEFLEFILNRELRFDDEHWAPYFMSCSPCHIPYNFIGNEHKSQIPHTFMKVS